MMDSMRGLGTSLPRASGKRRTQSNQELLLQTFKQAALSVTALYKQAAVDRLEFQKQGYQDALEDLLGFLDKEEIGLQDGEGWKIRRWATEGLQPLMGEETNGMNGGASDEEDEETEDLIKRDRSASPSKHSRDPSAGEPTPVTLPDTIDSESSHIRSASAPPIPLIIASSISEPRPIPTFAVPSASEFAFRSAHAMPNLHDMDLDNGIDATSNNRAMTQAPNQNENMTRIRRNKNNLGRGSGRAGSSISLGSGAGSKRRLPLDSWFDITGVSGREGAGGGSGGGSKRGKFV